MRLGVTMAAFVNGAWSQALEYDDTHNESIVHMSSPSVAAALALAEYSLSGRLRRRPAEAGRYERSRTLPTEAGRPDETAGEPVDSAGSAGRRCPACR